MTLARKTIFRAGLISVPILHIILFINLIKINLYFNLTIIDRRLVILVCLKQYKKIFEVTA